MKCGVQINHLPHNHEVVEYVKAPYPSCHPLNTGNKFCFLIYADVASFMSFLWTYF